MAEYGRFAQLFTQGQWAKALKAGEFAVEGMPKSERLLRAVIGRRLGGGGSRGRCGRPQPLRE